MPTEFILIDGKDKIMGRLASQVAKLALLGKHVVVINAKDIVVSGSKKNIFATYVQMKNRKTASNPTKGPFFHRRPDSLFRRTVRGMLPFKKPRGQEAYKRIHAYVNGVEKGKWSGEKNWAEVAFPVTAGARTFEWTYSKDGSESGGDDTAWIDDIKFPRPP